MLIERVKTLPTIVDVAPQGGASFRLLGCLLDDLALQLWLDLQVRKRGLLDGVLLLRLKLAATALAWACDQRNV